jgi:hypothetical protein
VVAVFSARDFLRPKTKMKTKSLTMYSLSMVVPVPMRLSVFQPPPAYLECLPDVHHLRKFHQVSIQSLLVPLLLPSAEHAPPSSSGPSARALDEQV